ncbi:hypothetical protein DICA0_D14466 [Diutina catenulata]
MPRPKAHKCFSCRRLRIRCDQRTPCEYCAATGRHCEYPAKESPWVNHTVTGARIEECSSSESPSSKSHTPEVPTECSYVLSPVLRPTDATSFEISLFDTYWKWHRNTYVHESRPELNQYMEGLLISFFDMEVVRVSVLAYTGLLSSSESALEYTSNKLACQSRILNQAVDRLRLGTGSSTDALAVTVCSAILMDLLVCHPHPLIPVVNFDTRKGDYLGLIRGFQQSYRLSRPFYSESELRLIGGGIQSMPQGRVPFLEDVLHYTDDPSMEEALLALSTLVVEGVDERSPMTLRSFLYAVPRFHDAVYDRDPMALAILNILCSYFMLTGFYLHREHNIWVRHIEWYKDHWRYPWEPDLYDVVVTLKHRMLPRELVDFDPRNMGLECRIEALE